MSNYVTISDPENEKESGCQYANWLTDIPFLLFRSCKTGKYVRASRMLFGPKILKANHELGINSAHSTKEIWITEWTEGHRVCRIRSSIEPNAYWALTADRDNNLFISLETFERDPSNHPFKTLPDGKTISPSPFYIALLDGKIAFQYSKTNQWIHVKDETTLTLRDKFDSDCQFLFGTKVSFFRPSLLTPSIRLYLAASKFRNILHFKSILALSSESFVLLFQQDHIKVQTTQGKYWALDKHTGFLDNTATSIDSSLRIRLLRAESNTWNILAGLDPTDHPSSYHLEYQDKQIIYEFLAENEENRLCMLSKLNTPIGGHYSIQLLPEIGLYLIHEFKEHLEEKGMVFRCPLEDIVEREREFAKVKQTYQANPLNPPINNQNNPANIINIQAPQIIPGVPSIVRDCIEYLKDRLSSQGLFRVCGIKSKVDRIKAMIDKGFSLKDAIAIEEQTSGVSEHEIASLLKLYFSELPEPLLTYELYDLFLEVPNIVDESQPFLEILHPPTGELLDHYSLPMRIRLHSLIKRRLPKVNYDTAQYLFDFLRSITHHFEQNKMNAANLSIVFGPNLLKPRVKSEDCFSNINPSSHKLITILIIDFPNIF